MSLLSSSLIDLFNKPLVGFYFKVYQEYLIKLYNIFLIITTYTQLLGYEE